MRAPARACLHVGGVAGGHYGHRYSGGAAAAGGASGKGSGATKPVQQPGASSSAWHCTTTPSPTASSRPAASFRWASFREFEPWTEASAAGPGRHGTSWLLMILPFLEQANLYHGWNFAANVMGNATVAQTDMPASIAPPGVAGCAAAIQNAMLSASWIGGGTDYGGCLGGQRVVQRCGQPPLSPNPDRRRAVVQPLEHRHLLAQQHDRLHGDPRRRVQYDHDR